jgi:hypothetical protein
MYARPVAYKRFRPDPDRQMLKTSRLAILFVTVLVDMVGFGIVLPLLPFYAEEFGASPFEVTLLIASFSAMQFVAVPDLGPGLGLAGTTAVHHRRALRLGRLVPDLRAGGVAAGALRLPHRRRARRGHDLGGAGVRGGHHRPGDRAHGLGMLGAASGLGVLIGPAIGGYFSSFGYAVPGFIAAALCVANGVAAIFFLPESASASVRTGTACAARRERAESGGGERGAGVGGRLTAQADAAELGRPAIPFACCCGLLPSHHVVHRHDVGAGAVRGAGPRHGRHGHGHHLRHGWRDDGGGARPHRGLARPAVRRAVDRAGGTVVLAASLFSIPLLPAQA